MADETAINTSSEWLQLYEESLHAQHMLNNNCSFVLSDATTVATTIDSPRKSTTSPPSSSPLTPNNHQDSCSSKPIRKRCRASKKKPTTHLNATAYNFRDLVQKFTGCPKKSMTFGSQKGPIKLNFKLGTVQNHRGSRNILSTYGYDYDQYQQQQSQIGQPLGQLENHRHRYPNNLKHQYQQQQVLEDKKGSSMACSFDGHDQKDVSSDHPIMPNNLEVIDDGFLSDGFDLREYSVLEESFSREIVNGF